ncbi:MAG: rhodanese-like domain-containing protein [Phycisphaerales bacterium]
MSSTAAVGTNGAGGAGDASPARQVAPTQVHEWLRAGEAVLIDVREPDEHAREHIAGSHLVPLSKFDPARAGALTGPGQRLVVHCKSGRRGADACRLASALEAAGMQVFNMTGGIEAWKGANLPVTIDTAVARISVMRQVQLTIGIGVLAGCALGWLVHPGFFGLAAFFGAGLVVAGASGTCGLALLMQKMPWNQPRRA